MDSQVSHEIVRTGIDLIPYLIGGGISMGTWLSGLSWSAKANANAIRELRKDFYKMQSKHDDFGKSIREELLVLAKEISEQGKCLARIEGALTVKKEHI